MKERVLSGMRPTGALHLGHYHGALKNWVRLQSEMDCFYFVADWHALTTHYENREVIEKNVYEMVIDWLAAGLDPNQCTLFCKAAFLSMLSCSRSWPWVHHWVGWRSPTAHREAETAKAHRG